jgi:NADPH:quinone reductase
MQLTDNKSGDIIIDTLEGNTLSDSGKILNQMGAGSYIGGY